MKRGETSYKKAVTYLYGLQKYGIKFGLSKTSNLLEAVGNPHKGKKYIHIGGTNGKGSVAAVVAAILEKAGLRVGLYSSPHLVRFTERFKINDQEIGQEETTALINELREAIVPEEPPTFFEATTAMALIYFARKNTDLAVMEVGMGGRLDATNVITPLVSVITNISMEHEFFLGSRLLDIAREKGGIIKPGVDAITGATQPAVIQLFEFLCKERQAPLWRVGRHVRYRTTPSGFHYHGIKRRLNGLDLGLRGRFQRRNAALALAAIERLEEKGVVISTENIRTGLKDVRWPGRMQVVAKAPTIILDGAHNPAAIQALAESLKTGYEYRRLILVLGVMNDKAIGKMLRRIVPLADHVIYTRPEYPRAASPEILMAKGAGLEKSREVVPRLTGALDKARTMAGPQDLVVVCGSLFTVGEAMTYFDPKTYKPDAL
jgi:dihydrofolate synthase/folylpolyglutamate synthase